jgi:hypothetical protein
MLREFMAGLPVQATAFSTSGSARRREKLAKVYGFNFDFLDRFGGCHDAAEMFA